MINKCMIDDALRYAGMRIDSADEKIKEEVYKTLEFISKNAYPKKSYKKLEVYIDKATKENKVYFPQTTMTVVSADLYKLFENASKAYIMAVTLGKEIDTYIRTRQKNDMLGALLLDACASAYVEGICDELESEIMEHLDEGTFLTMRFSPGYGDVPLELSESILNILQAPKTMGLMLTKSNMLIPTKSITAMVGVSNQLENRQKSCARCNLVKTCMYRKRGKQCGRK